MASALRRFPPRCRHRGTRPGGTLEQAYDQAARSRGCRNIEAGRRTRGGRAAAGPRQAQRRGKVRHGATMTHCDLDDTRNGPRVRRPRPHRDKRTRLADWHRMDQALQRACTYPHPAGRLVRIETHISVVYLAGRYAYKICKPVKLGFVDFTTRHARMRCCREALRLNRRLAPSLYLAIVPIRRTGRTFKIGALGTPFEYALKMRRFDERKTLSALLVRDELRTVDIDHIAARLASFHVRASRHAPNPLFGSAARMREQLDSVLASLDREVPSRVSSGMVNWCREEMARLHAHIDMRQHRGFVRECHGDLHLDNMVRLDADVAFFDCIDFSDELRWIDVTADIAFVVMDLLAHERGDLAIRFLNRWLTSTGDFAGLPALRLYVVYRALVRALVAALKRHGKPRDDADATALENYLRLAARLIAPPQTFLILCHGFSGSGKSVASEALAQQIGAIRISSDIERKRMTQPLAAAQKRSLESAAYTREAIDANYAHLRAIASQLLEAGFPVIVDASFLRRVHRSSFIALAAARSIPVFVVDFQADLGILVERLRKRAMQAGEASDADETILRLQLTEAEPLTCDESALVVTTDTAAPLDSFDKQTFWGALLDRLAASRGWLSDQHAPAGHYDASA